MNPTSNNNKKVVAGSLIGLIVVALIAAIVYYEAHAHDTASQPSLTTPSQVPAATNSSPSATNSYKDGTYSASDSYYVPHGDESIKVTLTLKNGVIMDSTIANSENNPESAQFQEQFASQYKSGVVGQNISSVQLSYVAGASDTTQAFDSALQQIMNQARA